MLRTLWQIVMGRERQRSKRVRRPPPQPVRLFLEDLEGRAAPSVSIAQFTDPSGAVGFPVKESRRDDTVTITDNSTAEDVPANGPIANTLPTCMTNARTLSISNAVWSTSGKYGGALKFSGRNLKNQRCGQMEHGTQDG